MCNTAKKVEEKTLHELAMELDERAKIEPELISFFAPFKNKTKPEEHQPPVMAKLCPELRDALLTVVKHVNSCQKCRTALVESVPVAPLLERPMPTTPSVEIVAGLLNAAFPGGTKPVRL